MEAGGSGAVNGAVVRLARLEGSFPGTTTMKTNRSSAGREASGSSFSGREPVEFGAGDIFVVPRRSEPRPVAESVAYTLLLEQQVTKQYGD